jgi:PAS domain S-box-containing protein
VYAVLDFRVVLERSPNPYMVLDRDLRYIWANHAYLRVTGSRLDELLGRHVLDAFPDDPDDPANDRARQLRESLERALTTGEEDVLAFIPYRVGDEERFWSATHTPIRDDTGAVAFVLQHTVDITELHRLRHTQTEAGVLQRAQQVQQASLLLDAERRHLRQLFEQAPGFIAFLRGGDHVFELANAAYRQLIGHRDLIGRPVRDALPEVASQGVLELLDGVLASGEPYVGRGVRVLLQRQPGGTMDERYLDFVYQPIVDARGTVAGIFVQGHDVTEQREASRLKDEFLATLSHELRTPLNAMLGWIRMLRTQSMDDGKREHALGIIERNASAQARLVQDMLDMSSIITGKLRLHVVPVAIGDVVAAAIETVRPAADAKGVTVRRTGEAPQPIAGDPHRLQQVVWNLLNNAVKFTPAGGHVEVTVTQTPETTVLTVADDGVGIAPQLLPVVFERFRQGETSHRLHGGLGLGLSIVKHVVEAHGGSVTAASPGPGRGATFVVELPRSIVPPMSQEGKAVSVVPGGQTPVRGDSRC